jgi:hypothetical protein
MKVWEKRGEGEFITSRREKEKGKDDRTSER